MEPLDTNVQGEPDAIEASADAFDRYGTQVDHTVDNLAKVDGRRERSWDGPASEACGTSVSSLRKSADELHPQVQKATRAARDLAGELRSVKNKMHQAIDTAHKAQLQVNGDFIMPPTPPGPAPAPPEQGPVPRSEANGAASQAHSAQAAHQQACKHYNQQLAAFKKAKSLVEDARKQEKNAHHDYESKVGQVTSTVDQIKDIGSTGVSWALSYVKGANDEATELFAKAHEIRETGGIMSTANANLAENKALKREKLIKKVPKGLRDVASKNPTTTFQRTFDEGSKVFKWAKPVAKGVPYVGTALNGVSHVYDAAKGRESWGKAAAHFGAETAGGAAGGAAAGAAVGSVFPGVGTVIGGVAGGIAGSIGGDAVVDWFSGD